MQIPRSALDQLTSDINRLSLAAQKTVNGVPISLAEEYMVDACASLSDMVAARTAEFYDYVREQSVGSPLGAIADAGYVSGKTRSSVKAFARKPETFNSRILERVDYEAKRASGNAMYLNGKRDPLNPRFARVPTGAETCPFCIMLASRGFIYTSFGSAGGNGHWHANCDCRIVQGYDTYEAGVSRRLSKGTSVEGYKPDALYDQYLKDLRDGKLKPASVRKYITDAAQWSSEQFKTYLDFTEFISLAKDIQDLQYRSAVAEQEASNLTEAQHAQLHEAIREKRNKLGI